MKTTSCGIVQDLLPLVVEGLASPDSQGLVQARLAQCPACRQAAACMQRQPEAPKPDDLTALRRFRTRLENRTFGLFAAGLAVVLVLVFLAARLLPHASGTVDSLSILCGLACYAAALPVLLNLGVLAWRLCRRGNASPRSSVAMRLLLALSGLLLIVALALLLAMCWHNAQILYP